MSSRARRERRALIAVGHQACSRERCGCGAHLPGRRSQGASRNLQAPRVVADDCQIFVLDAHQAPLA